jgi:ATP-dependent exoDNAse (exonuclease V) beta subunit
LRAADWRERVLEVFEASLRTDAMRETFRRPGAHARVWRELPFLHEGPGGAARIGTIDRLVSVDDASGRAQRATVYDFKTGHVAFADAAAHAERYRAQLEAYRQAASRLLELDEERIEMVIVFTTSGVVASVHRSAADAGAS